MASPGQQTLCCMMHKVQDNSSVTTFSDDINFSQIIETYNWICLVSALLSVCGATYQILPRQPRIVPRTKREMDAFLRQSNMICWLAIADLLASTGIIVRSAVWLVHKLPREMEDNASADAAHIFCAIISGWIMFFYLSTYVWTVSYSYDIFLLVNEKPSAKWVYHLVGWLLPLVLTLAGMLPVYLPSLTSCQYGTGHWLPNYIVTYSSILVAMVLTPMFYIMSSRKVEITLRSRGLYTDNERKTIQNIRTKYFSVTLVFFICWSPNLLNGVLIIVHKKVLPGVFIALWNYMAVVNPMQALLNSLVYRGFVTCRLNWGRQTAVPDRRSTPFRHHKPREGIQYHSTTEFEDSENAPLLSFRSQSARW